MAVRTLLLRGAAVVALAVAFPLMPGLPGSVSPVLAEVDVSIEVGTFYDRLAPHGDWVSYEGGYVFVPAATPADWRPYTRGHWEFTKRHGWVWVSDEPFGWATYHYGRWGYKEDIGWYWVPGTRWAPAWVEWRRTDDHVAWTPLPPEGEDLAFHVAVGPRPNPDRHWAVVPAQSFLSVNLALNLVDRDDEVVRVVRRARPLGRVHVENNIVINNVIDVNFVERRTKKKVKVREIREARNVEQAGKADENSLAVFNPKVEKKKAAKPKRTETVEKVVRKKKTGETALRKQQTDEEAADPSKTDDQAADPTKTDTDAATLKQQRQQARKKGQKTGAGQEAVEGDAASQSEEVTQKPVKAGKKKQPGQKASTDSQALQGEATETDTTARQKKKAAQQRKLQKQQLQQEQSVEQPAKAKKKQQQQSLNQPGEAADQAKKAQKKRQQGGEAAEAPSGKKKQSAAAAQEEPNKKKKKPAQQ